jgi:DNA-directed RNA polymerase subunit M/transcription elongation factor TFIIS
MAKNKVKDIPIDNGIMSDVIKNEYEDITIDNFSYEKEYVKDFGFITMGSSSIKINLIKYALENINREESRKMINKYVGYDYISEDIENSIFEFALVNVTINAFPKKYVVMIYNDKLNDICENLDSTNTRIDNKTLLRSILEMRVKPTIIAFLPPEQLHPMRHKDILDKMNLREKTLNSLQTTDLYKCRKCGERRFKISTMQTRCADEPETKFLTCLVCYNTFTR